MFLKPCHRNELDKLQAKLVKCIVGVGQQFRTTPLLQALKMVNISQIIDINNLFLLKNVLYSNSAATSFYSLMLKKNVKLPYLLTTRVTKICQNFNIDMLKFIFNDNYAFEIKNRLLSSPKNNENGLVDSIRDLLGQDANVFNLNLLKLLLKAF